MTASWTIRRASLGQERLLRVQTIALHCDPAMAFYGAQRAVPFSRTEGSRSSGSASLSRTALIVAPSSGFRLCIRPCNRLKRLMHARLRQFDGRSTTAFVKGFGRRPLSRSVIRARTGIRPPPVDPFADLPKLLAPAARDNVAVKISGACILSHEPFPYRDIRDSSRASSTPLASMAACGAPTGPAQSACWPTSRRRGVFRPRPGSAHGRDAPADL
jgi:hypothetical protein